MKRTTLLLLCLCGWLIISCCTRNNKIAVTPWRLENGTLYIFSGTMNNKKTMAGIEVLRSIQRGTLTFFIMKGYPDDLLEGEDWESSHWGLLKVGNDRYYRIAEQGIDSIEKRISDPNDNLAGIVQEQSLLLQLPLNKDKMYGETFQLTRTDSLYCWCVKGSDNYDPSPLKIEGLKNTMVQFTLRYATIADETLIDFVPGLGITGYRYHHHGTPNEIAVKLMEVKTNPDN